MTPNQPELLPTPRSDAARISVTNGTGTRPGDIVSVQFARQLERELNEALDALKAIASCTFPQRGSGGGAHRQMSAVDMAKLAGDAIARSHDEMSTRQSQAVGVEIAIQLRDALLRFDIDYDLTEGEEANIVLTKEDQDTLRAAVLALENLNATPNDSGKEGGGE